MRKLFLILIILIIGYFAYQKFFNIIPSSDDVIVFTADNCPPCSDITDLLDEHDINYIEYNVNDSDENFNLFRKKKGHRLPLLLIGDERIEGYDEDLLQIAINEFYEYDSDIINVVMYSKPRCGWCDKARQFLQKNGIEFQEYDITASSAHRQAFENLGGHGTPLICIGDNKIRGFNEKAIRMALRQFGMI